MSLTGQSAGSASAHNQPRLTEPAFSASTASTTAAGASWGALCPTKKSMRCWMPPVKKRDCPSEARERGKIKPATSFHITRHTWASLAVMNGTPLLVVAKNLGHRDTRMVEKHYGHLAPSFITEAIRAGAPRYGVKDDKRVVPLG